MLCICVPEWIVCLLQSTPLHLAAGYNRVKTVQLLLQHGADVHAKDKGCDVCVECDLKCRTS